MITAQNNESKLVISMLAKDATKKRRETVVVPQPEDLLKFRIPLKLEELCSLNSTHLRDVVEEIIKSLNR